MRVGAAAITIMLALGASAGAGCWFLSSTVGDGDPTGVALVKVGPELLKIPGSYLRVETSARDDSGPVELAAFFPGFTPAGRVDDVTARTDLNDRFERIVFISVKSADAGLDPSERTARLYQRFLDETSWSYPGGLISSTFQAGSPFEGDELYYAPPEGRQFTARCRRPDPTRKTPNTCEAIFRSGDLDIDVRFSAALLSEWQNLVAGSRGLIEAARR